MLNLPIVKFEKSCNYLNEQLTLQNNNKQLILDIISNIGLILNDSEEKFEQYDNILETANEFLKTISSNITSIEQLNVEIKNITAELTSLLSEQNKTSKTKEFYIAAFSNIKHNIIVYSKKFQELENTLTTDNNKFNEFINENNFKYNFVSIDDSTNSYTFTGFSINDSEEIANDVEVVENTNTDNEASVTEDVTEDSVETVKSVENIETNDIEEATENVVETENDENLVVEENIVENEEETTVENTEVSPTENISKIDELTNEFKSLLLNISETNLSDATSSVVSLFKELLPQESSATFEDFLDLGNKSEEISKEETTILDEINEAKNNLEEFDPEKIVDDYIIKELEAIIFEAHSGLIYEYDEELDTFVSYEKEIVEDEEIINESTTSEETVALENDDTLIEATEELFTEDLSDVDEEIENTNDIEILIDNLETIETVEKSIFEELNDVDTDDTSSLLSEISLDDILDNTELNLEDEAINSENTSDAEDISNDDLNEEILEKTNAEDVIDEETSDEDLVVEDSENNDIDLEEDVSDENEVSLSALDLLNDIDLLDNFDNSILEETNLIEEETIEDDIAEDNLSEIELDENEGLEPEPITDNEEKNIVDEILDVIEENDDEVDQEESNNVEHFYKEGNNKNATFKNKGMSKKDFDSKLIRIENALEDNRTLVISERLQKIYLPYKVSELVNYVESYPGSYTSLRDVVNQEFILPFDYFRKHPSKARFTEAYNLLKNREGRNFMKSVSYAFRLLNKNNLNPAIIASCKTQHELDSYLYYLDSDNLNNFKFFDIIYEVNPM
ncbi:MAG: hypothetical protein IJW20_05425 [Clostridia bacterium]|nr:hypothetical protein [Clostridia bacterium]